MRVLMVLLVCAAVWAQVPDGMNPEQVTPTASVTTTQVVETRPHVQLRPLTAQEEADVRAYMQKYMPGIVKSGDDPRAVESAIRFLLGIDQSHDTPLTRRPKEYEADWQTATQLLNRTRWLGSVDVPQPRPLPPFTPAYGVPPVEPTELAELPEIPGLVQLPPVWLEPVRLDCQAPSTPCPPTVCRRPAGAIWYGGGGARNEWNVGSIWGYWRDEPPQNKPPEPPGPCPPGEPPPSPPPGGGCDDCGPPPPANPNLPGNGGPGNNPGPPATPGVGGGSPPPHGGTGGAYPAPNK
jgi:hypothetical protein